MSHELPKSYDPGAIEVRWAEYWVKEFKTRTLCRLADGSSAYFDELPEGAPVIEQREEQCPCVKQYIIDGVEIHDETEWLTPDIPVIPQRGLTREVDGKEEHAGLIVVEGRLQPPLLAGRPPARPDEVALGAKTMRRLRASVGSTIEITSFTGRRLPYRVVGKAVVPADADPRLGEGAVLSRLGLARVIEGSQYDTVVSDSLFVRFAPGAN